MARRRRNGGSGGARGAAGNDGQATERLPRTSTVPAAQKRSYSTAFGALCAGLVAIAWRFDFFVQRDASPEPWEDQELTLVVENEDPPAEPIDARPSKDDFYLHAWDDGSLMGRLFPGLERLRAAWEVHPLLSKASFARPEIEPLNSIPTLFHDGVSLRDRFEDPLLSLFAVDDTVGVLSQIANERGLVHCRPAKNDVQLPATEYSVEQLSKYIHQEGYSVIIDQMEMRWSSLAEITRQLEEELGAQQMNANLYLTPEASSGDGAVRRGVGVHWDLMDVIVVHLAGRKRWSVAKDPIFYLSSRDQQRPPTREEENYYARHNRFMDFTMCPGDVLYLPRGHMHNASNVVFNSIKRKWLDWDACPSSPKDAPEADSPAERANEASLHLTFGVWPDNTVQELVHHALQGYFGKGPGKNTVAIPAKTCTSNYRRVLQDDIGWQTVLHQLLGEVVRRENDCDSSSQRGIAATHPRKCDAVLRRSIPLLLLKNNELVEDVANEPDARVLGAMQAYLKALDAFFSSASIPQTIAFIEWQLFRPPTPGMRPFRYPGSDSQDAIVCPQTLRSLSDEFPLVLDDFVAYAKANFFPALQRLNAEGKRTRDHNRSVQRWALDR